MQSIWRCTLRPRRRPLVFPATSGSPRRHPSALVGRDPPPVRPAALTLPDKLPAQLSRLDYELWHMQHNIGVRSEKKQVKLDWTSKKMDVVDAGQDVNQNVHDNNLTAVDVTYPAEILEGSSHRDGAIYKGNWESCYNMDIANRSESVSDLKKPTRTFDCHLDQENCVIHVPGGMMQIFFVEIG